MPSRNDHWLLENATYFNAPLDQFSTGAHIVAAGAGAPTHVIFTIPHTPAPTHEQVPVAGCGAPSTEETE